MLLGLLLAPFAAACPTIATGSGTSLSFDVAQVAIVRQGTRTTFSVSVNPFGDPQDFALVLPVPVVLEESDIRTLEGQIFASLDGYTAPRHVTDAGCGGYYYGYGDCGMYAPADDADSGATEEGGVDVEAEYLVGEYHVTILSSTDANALQTWLDTNGYALPDGAEAILGEYIESGSYFLAAQVAEGATMADGTPLSPLQIAYDSEIFAIPIRLATLNSPGEQDMVIYAITDTTDGRVGIANYPEIEVPDGCVWGDASEDFGAFYDGLFTEAWAAADDAAWTVEFAGPPGSCNPCTSVWVDETQLADLGYVGDYWNHFLTRIHMRYTPEQARQELSLYASGTAVPDVKAYADDTELNYECIPTFCDGTATPQPEEEEEADDACDTGGDDAEPLADSCGCNGTTGAGAAATALGLAVLARRRRIT